MPFWGSRDYEAVDDFDDYDPTPYSGGYDQVLTYGRPLSPSDEMCYSVSTAGDIDYDRPKYSSGSQTSAYEAEGADFGDRYGQCRPKPQIDSSSGYGGDGGAVGEYGSGYTGRPQRQEYGSDYGVGYGGGRPKRDEEDEGYGGRAKQESGYGYQEEMNRYGVEGYGGSGYRKNDEKPSYGGGDFRRSGEEGYGNQSYGGGDYKRSDEEGYGKHGYGGGEYRKNEEEGYGGGDGGYNWNEKSGYGGRTSYGGNEEGSGGYKKSSYGDEQESGGFRNPSRYGGEEYEGYGRSNYVSSLPHFYLFLLLVLFSLW